MVLTIMDVLEIAPSRSRLLFLRLTVKLSHYHDLSDFVASDNAFPKVSSMYSKKINEERTKLAILKNIKKLGSLFFETTICESTWVTRCSKYSNIR